MSGGGTTDVDEPVAVPHTHAAAPLKLHQRVAVITGGTRGIGRGIAEAFLAEGAAVVISGKSSDKGKQAVEEIGAGDRVSFVPCDVRVQSEVEHLIDETRRIYGRVDILVNNAGGTDGWALVHELSDNAWQNALNWNLNSVFWGTRRALRYMLDGGWGRIINISSVEGKQSLICSKASPRRSSIRYRLRRTRATPPSSSPSTKAAATTTRATCSRSTSSATAPASR